MGVDQEAVLAANEAFYRAFNARDAQAMEALWARESPVHCVHPGWRPLRDRASVMASWKAIFEGGSSPRVTAVRTSVTVLGDVAWVVCYERIAAGDGALVATNVFVREATTWRIAHHQAGPLSQPMEKDIESPGTAPVRPPPKRTLN